MNGLIDKTDNTRSLPPTERRTLSLTLMKCLTLSGTAMSWY